MDALQDVARRHGLKIVEDACQSHGAEYRGRRAGSLGNVGCFSFYPAKNLGACGDGGAVVTNDAEVAERLRCLRNYGQRIKNEHDMLGFNCRLDTLQAAILLVKLRHLESWTEARRWAANKYREVLAEHADLVLPRERPEVRHVYHLFVVQHPERDALFEHLKRQGIQSGIHYPAPLHHAQPFRTARTVPTGLPVCTQLASCILSLPMYPELTAEHIERVAQQVGVFTPIIQLV
jgi:dTDP-4-amino-4,6-dideoxygalactose transaminase